MNYNKGLILIENQDKTLDVEYYKSYGSRIWIKFKNSEKTYKYGRGKVVVDTFVKEQILNGNEVVIYNTEKLLNVIKIIKFSVHSLLFTDNNKKLLALNKELSVNDSQSEQVLLKYFKNIAESIEYANENNFCSILKNTFNRLDKISVYSALNQYLGKNNSTVTSISCENLIFPFDFNLSQRKATIEAFNSSISVIEGPPGTGKTQTILNIIANLIIDKKTVGVVSNNNDAFLNVKEKLDKYGFGFLCASLGKKENVEIFFSNIDDYQLPDNIDDWEINLESTYQLSKEVSKLQDALTSYLENINKQAHLRIELEEYTLEKGYFDRLVKARNFDEIEDLSFFNMTETRIINFLVDNEKYLTEDNNISNINKIKFIFKYGFLKFKKLSAQNDDFVLYLQKKFYDLKINRISSELLVLEKLINSKKINNQSKRLRELSNRLFRAKIFNLMQGQQREDTFTKDNYKHQFTAFKNRFPIMLSTTHSIRNIINSDELLDYLIIDEASQSDLLSAVLALSCAKNVIVVGDLKQLPNIVSSKVKEVFQNKFSNTKLMYEYDYFNHSILSSIKVVFKDKIPVTLLREHYRCNNKIIQFCNKKFYDGALIPLSKNQANNPLVMYRVAPGNHSRITTRGDKGIYNQREIDIVQEFLCNDKFNEENYQDIGFVSPFRKQVQKSSTCLNKAIEKNTVHKYQGREKSTIIFSTVLDKTKSSIKLIDFVDNPNLINVAVSRAVNRFVLITDQKLFLKKGQNIGDLVRYIEYISPENSIDSEVVSVFDLLYDEYSKKLHSFKQKIINRSKYQSENIMYALLEDIMSSKEFLSYKFKTQIRLSNLVKLKVASDQDEINFLNHHRTSVDFVIYNKFNNEPILGIEVDGVEFHENNPQQLERDRIKDKLLMRSKLPLLRLSTDGSGEKNKIIKKLKSLTKGDIITSKKIAKKSQEK